MKKIYEKKFVKVYSNPFDKKPKLDVIETDKEIDYNENGCFRFLSFFIGSLFINHKAIEDVEKSIIKLTEEIDLNKEEIKKFREENKNKVYSKEQREEEKRIMTKYGENKTKLDNLRYSYACKILEAKRQMPINKEFEKNDKVLINSFCDCSSNFENEKLRKLIRENNSIIY